MSSQTTTTPSFLQGIEQFAIDEATKIKTDIVAFWNYEEPIFVAELKSLGQQLITIGTGLVAGVAAQVASGQIKSSEALGQLAVQTYQTAIAQGLNVVEADAQAAAKQVAGAVATVAETGAPPAQTSAPAAS